MSNTRDKSINLRVNETEKNEISNLAESVGIDVSTLIRNAVLTKEKIVLLSDGTVISKNLFTLLNDFNNAVKNGKVDSTYELVILGRIDELISAFNNLTNSLTDFSEEEEEE